MKSNKKIKIVLGLGLILWVGVHIPSLFFGTHDIPMHQMYVADEQRPVNGALHMLKEKSPFGLRGKEEFWYGPIFAVLATPAVVFDFGKQALFDGIRTAEDYKNSIIFDWGGVVLGLHVTVVVAGTIALFLAYRMFLLKTLNSAFDPNRRMLFAGLATGYLGMNYFFFENSTIFMNWIFVAFFLIAQLYLGLLIYESRGKRQLYWWLHGIVTVLNFGINYFNIIYMIAYIPLAIMLWRKNEEKVRQYLYTYVALVILGLFAIILWNPYTFIRLLGFLGIGTMAEKMGTVYQNAFSPFQSSTTSYLYYLKVLLLNHLPIFLILALTARSVFVKRFKRNFMWLWMFGSVAVIHFIVFGAMSQNEERYVLMTTVTLLLLTGATVIKFLNTSTKTRFQVVLLVVLTVFYGFYHLAHIGKWIDIYADGPAEKEMISEVLKLQDSGSVAIIQEHIAGHVHTKDAYLDFIKQKNAKDVNLYKAIMVAPLPEGVEPMTARYIMPEAFEADPSIITGYEHVIRYQKVCSLEINQATYIGENITALWYWDLCKPKYEIIK